MTRFQRKFWALLSGFLKAAIQVPAWLGSFLELRVLF